MIVKSIWTIDVCDTETGEVLEWFDNVWGGDTKKVIAEISSRYSVDRVERDIHKECYTIWVVG